MVQVGRSARSRGLAPGSKQTQDQCGSVHCPSQNSTQPRQFPMSPHKRRWNGVCEAGAHDAENPTGRARTPEAKDAGSLGAATRWSPLDASTRVHRGAQDGPRGAAAFDAARSDDARRPWRCGCANAPYATAHEFREDAGAGFHASSEPAVVRDSPRSCIPGKHCAAVVGSGDGGSAGARHVPKREAR